MTSDVPDLVACPSGSVGGVATEEEDIPDLQLAWQVLELARVICTRYSKSTDPSFFISLSSKLNLQ